MDRPVGQSGPLSAASAYLIYQDGGIGDSQPQNMPGTEWKSANLNCFLWGLIRQDLPITNCRLANGQRLGIEEIRVGRNWLQVPRDRPYAGHLGADPDQLALLPPAVAIRNAGLRGPR